MAEGIKTPPKFDGLNFPIWKVKMTVFLQSLGSRVAKAVTKPFSVPIGDEGTWSDIATKEFDANAKAHYALFQALNDDDISRVIHCKSAYEICTQLAVTHEGTSQIKRAKIDLLRSQYENFTMYDNDTIDDMVTRFTKINKWSFFFRWCHWQWSKSKEGHSCTSTLMGSQGHYIEGAKR